MKILVAGASGLLGGEVVRLLKERGHYVRALSRDPGRAAKLKAMADDVRLGDATLPGTFDGVCAGIECVVSALGAPVSPSAKGTRSVADVDLAANLALLAEAKRAGVRRYIYVGVHTEAAYAGGAYVRAHTQFWRQQIHALQQRLAAADLNRTSSRKRGVLSGEGIDLTIN